MDFTLIEQNLNKMDSTLWPSQMDVISEISDRNLNKGFMILPLGFGRIPLVVYLSLLNLSKAFKKETKPALVILKNKGILQQYVNFLEQYTTVPFQVLLVANEPIRSGTIIVFVSSVHSKLNNNLTWSSVFLIYDGPLTHITEGMIDTTKGYICNNKWILLTDFIGGDSISNLDYYLVKRYPTLKSKTVNHKSARN